MKFLNLLSNGNRKLAKNVLCWSIPPVITCLNCEQCKKHCYARHPYLFYPVVKKAWDRNYTLAQTGEFTAHIIAQLKEAVEYMRKPFVRIHVSGDFFNQEYVNNWIKIIKTFPSVKFFGYTKVMDILDLTELVNLDNVNIINSIASDGGVNFGKAGRITELKNLGYRVCPADKNKNIKCGKNCFICMKIEKVCFPWHR
jgi:hypothetical protein